MLKHKGCSGSATSPAPAAFRRLCVETPQAASSKMTAAPAAFRRLCVETLSGRACCLTLTQPPSGGCVLKQLRATRKLLLNPSRLQAAVC